MTELEILKTARTKLEAGWTQGELARDAQGFPVGLRNPDACQFCLEGSLRCQEGSNWSPVSDRLQALLPAQDQGRLHLFNDRSTKAEVLALIDKAIQEVTP